MWTQQKTKGGEATEFGLGFAVEDGKQGLKISHNGGQGETATRMVLYPRLSPHEPESQTRWAFDTLAISAPVTHAFPPIVDERRRHRAPVSQGARPTAFATSRRNSFAGIRTATKRASGSILPRR
jgi:hypothetical protein